MSRKTPTPRPLRLEGVEDRCVPAVFNIADGDIPGFVAAVTAANTNGQADTINLATNGTYTFTTPDNTVNALPIILPDGGNNLTIVGNGSMVMRVGGAGVPEFRFFETAPGAKLTINRLTLSNGATTNAMVDGGALLITGAGTVVNIDQCAILNNSAGQDGGGFLVTTSATVNVTNSTFDGNTAARFGAGIAVNGLISPSTINMTNVTVFNNISASLSGGVDFFGTSTANFVNTIIFGNTAAGSTNTDIDNAGGTINCTNCIIGSSSASGLNGTQISTTTGVDPLLGPLQDNGGNILSRLPGTGSPAIDTGATALAAGTSDQRGSPFVRVFNTTVDIGAVEVQPNPVVPPVTPPTTPPTVPNVPLSPGVPLTPPTTSVGGTTGGTTTPFGTVTTTTTVAPDGTITVTTTIAGVRSTIVTTAPNGATRTVTIGANGVTSVQPAAGALPIVVGASTGGSPLVTVFNPQTGQLVRTILAYDPDFTGGVNVATGDVTGDGVPDVVTAPASGGGADIRVFDGVTGNLLISFLAYGDGFDGGANVAVGDVDGDGRPDIVTGAGEGGGPHVRAFSGAGYTAIRDFLAFAPGYAGGVTVAVADFDGDKIGDIVTATQTGGDVVQVFGRRNGVPLALSFSVPGAGTGLNVAAGDVTGDGLAEVIIGSRTGDGTVAVLDGRTLQPRTVARVFPGAGGVSVATINTDGDRYAEIVAGSGSVVRVLNGPTLNPIFDFLSIGSTNV